MNLFLSPSATRQPPPVPTPSPLAALSAPPPPRRVISVPSKSQLERACEIAQELRRAQAAEPSDDELMPDATDDLTDEDESNNTLMSEGADSDTQDDSSDDDDDDDGVAIETSANCDTFAFGHNVRANRALPKEWPVYEAYTINVPSSALKKSSTGEAMTWGQFASDDFSVATKRLLYLLFQSAERSLKGPICNPLHDLADPTATLHAQAVHERKMTLELQKGNPQGLVTRLSGIGGAYVPDITSDLSLAPLDKIMTPNPTPGQTTAKDADSGDASVFVFSQVGRDGDDDDGDDDGGEGPRRTTPTLVRRITVYLEELMTDRGGVTVGWRWWFLVHDPRIHLSLWMARVIQENKAVADQRQRLRESATNAGRRTNPRLNEPIDRIDSFNCHRAIRGPEQYVNNVRAYYRGPRRRRWNGNVSVPKLDASAVQYGIVGQATAVHPCRVFSPAIALEMQINSQVCSIQCSLNRYVSLSGLLGAVIRPTRTHVFNPVRLTAERLHSSSLPTDIHRESAIRRLMWRSLETHVDDLPEALKTAVAQKNMELAMSRWEKLAPRECRHVREIMERAVTEGNIEIAVEGMLRSDLVERPHKKRRLNGPSMFDDDDSDDDILVTSPLQFQDGEAHDDDDDDSDASAFSTTNPPQDDSGGDGAYDPEGEVNLAMFEHLRQVEETGSSLSETDVKRSPLLHLRMCNHRTRAVIGGAYETNTPQHRAAMDHFRQRALEVFWNTLQTYKEDSHRLSAPIRGALKFLGYLNQTPNRIHRHHSSIYGENPTGASAKRRAAAARQERGQLFLSMLSRSHATNDDGDDAVGGGDDDPSNPNRGFRDAWEADIGHVRRAERGLPEAWKRPPPASSIWHEWPYGGGWNLTAYGSWRVTMHHRCVHFFQCCPGNGPDRLHRLLLAQGTGWTYLWGLHGAQLLTGRGGVGKSYVLLCIFKQSFPGQVLLLDHLTERCFATNDDWNDLVIIIEEAPPRFVGQDEKGNVVAGDELLKTLMTRHCVNTVQPHYDKETGERTRMTFTARTMLTLMAASNIEIKYHKNGEKPAILRRWMMDHVGWGKQTVPLAEINNQMSVERSTTEQAAFYHQLAVTNALCLLVEKLIEAKVLDDICTDICSFHFPWYFDQVHRRCGVPKISGSTREMLIQLCRQTCLRYAVHKVFFSETAADTVRCKRRAGAGAGHPQTGPSCWEARAFDPFMLLQVQPHLVVTEEMMVDVLTTTRSTYIPTTRWGALDVIFDLYKQGNHRFRRRTKRQIQAHQNRATTKRTRDAAVTEEAEEEEEEEEGEEALSLLQEVAKEAEGAEEDQMNLFDCIGGAAGPSTASMTPAPSADTSSPMAMGTEYMDDRNYFAIVGTTLREVCDLLAQECHRSITSNTFMTELRGLHKEWMTHKDRNRPKQHRNGGIITTRAGKEIYDKKIKSPIVVWEMMPDEAPPGAYRSQGRERLDYQVCILIEYLERERTVSLNDILSKGLSYEGARTRQIVTALGVRDTFQVANMIHTHTYAGLHGGQDGDDDDDDDDDGTKHVTVRDYMGVIDIKPVRGRHLSRVNHFSESLVTDSLVYNTGLNAAGDGPPEWGDDRGDPRRQHQIFLAHDLNEMIITEYWRRAGIRINPANYPWNYTETLRTIARQKKDRTGVPTSNRLKPHYPDSYRQADPSIPLHSRIEPESLQPQLVSDEMDEETTQTSDQIEATAARVRRLQPFFGRDMTTWMASQRKRKR